MPPTVADALTIEAGGDENTPEINEVVSEEKLAVVARMMAVCSAAVCAAVALRGA